MDAVHDQALRAREQCSLDRHDPVSGHTPVFDEALVALAGPGGRGAFDGVSGYREVAQARLRVKGAWEEFVYSGDGGEAFLICDGVGGAKCDQTLYTTVAGVATAAVWRISPDIHPARETTRRVAHEHRSFRFALEQCPIHRARHLEDQLSETPEVTQCPVQGRNRGHVHLGAGDLLQHTCEVLVTTWPPGSPTDDHYGSARHAREYIRPSGQARVEAIQYELYGERGEQDAEDARKYVRPGLPEELHDAGGEEQGAQGQNQDHKEYPHEQR
jgi:hypothetical protein